MQARFTAVLGMLVVGATLVISFGMYAWLGSAPEPETARAAASQTQADATGPTIDPATTMPPATVESAPELVRPPDIAAESQPATPVAETPKSADEEYAAKYAGMDQKQLRRAYFMLHDSFRAYCSGVMEDIYAKGQYERVDFEYGVEQKPPEPEPWPPCGLVSTNALVKGGGDRIGWYALVRLKPGMDAGADRIMGELCWLYAATNK